MEGLEFFTKRKGMAEVKETDEWNSEELSPWGERGARAQMVGLASTSRSPLSPTKMRTR